MIYDRIIYFPVSILGNKVCHLQATETSAVKQVNYELSLVFVTNNIMIKLYYIILLL